eukprot:EG_transcript_20460
MPFTILLLGPPQSGKSSLIRRTLDGAFLPKYEATLGVSFHDYVLGSTDPPTEFQFWDCPGVVAKQLAAAQTCGKCSGVLLVYDITSDASFAALQKAWQTGLEAALDKHIPLIVCGNKCDLPTTTRREMTRLAGLSHRAELWAALAGGLHFRVSAKANTNMTEVLGTLASLLSTGQRRPLLSKSELQRLEQEGPKRGGVLSGFMSKLKARRKKAADDSPERPRLQVPSVGDSDEEASRPDPEGPQLSIWASPSLHLPDKSGSDDEAEAGTGDSPDRRHSAPEISALVDMQLPSLHLVPLTS